MSVTITREEALRRLKATQMAKQHRIAVLKERMAQKCKADMDDETQNIVFI